MDVRCEMVRGWPDVLFDIISDETISSAVRIAVSNETAFQTR